MKLHIGALVACLLLLSAPLIASPILIDENGNGFVDGVRLSFALQPDPGPGGLGSVLTYFLPFTGVQGDILLTEGVGGPVFDVLRFNGNGTVIFYSDNVPIADSLADTTGPPAVLYANQVTLVEVGPEGANSAAYAPIAGQPGFDATSNPTYTFVSDGTAAVVPEPGTLILMGSGLALFLRRRKKLDSLTLS